MKRRLVLEYTKKLNLKQRNVFEILVCPIVATKNINEIGIYLKGDKKIILSSQAYEGNPDEDMCDLAIGFYEILYKLKKGEILKQLGSVEEWTYAGDTMNSFKTIAKFSSVDKRNEWNEVYHCLANFWMLPGNIGRKTNKDSKNSTGKYANPITIKSFNTGRRDFVDRFLEEKHKDDLVEFSKKHFINEIYISNNKIKYFSKVDEGCTSFQEAIDSIIDTMISNICKRAVAIVCDDEKCDYLFDYFADLNLL